MTDSIASKEQQHVFEVIEAIVHDFVTEGRGDPVADLDPATPFMAAGLDSLDMLKVGCI